MTAVALATGRAGVTRARNGVFWVFAANGFAFAAWASRIPDIKRVLDLTPGALGGLLLAVALGSVLGLPVAGRVIGRLGTRRAVLAGMTVVVTGMALASVSVDVLRLMPAAWAALFFTGLGMGIWDVSMNHEGAFVERELGKAIMPWFHAAFSGATVASALVGSALVAWGVPVWVHIWVVLALVVLAARHGTSAFLRVEEPEAERDAERAVGRPAWFEPRTLVIGLVVLAAAFTEGSANDWIAVALVEGHHVPAWQGVLAFAIFLGFMTVGRIGGTALLDRYGRVPVLRVLFAVALVGSVLVVFGNAVLAFVGAALWGLGASLGFPVGMSAASDDPARAAARLSVVSTIGYLAFLGGPPLLGYLGDHTGVLHAMLAVAALLVPALLALPAVREPAR